MELKYIKKQNLSENEIEKQRNQAYAQLQDYAQAEEFVGKDIVKWILIFSKNECVLNELV